MPSFLIGLLAFGKANWKWLAPVVLAIAVAIGIALVYLSGHNAGVSSTELKTEKAHSASVATARSDERTAQGAADKVGADTAATNTRQRDETGAILKEIHDALPAPRPVDPIVSDSVRARSNDLIARANRAAGNAEAANGIDAERTSATH